MDLHRWIAVCLPLALAGAGLAGAAPPARFVTVALEGEPAPGGVETLRAVFSGQHLNDRGDVGFVANLGPVGSGLSVSFVRFFQGGFDALRNDDIPPAAWGAYYSFLTAPAVNEQREFALMAGGPANGWVLESGGVVSVLSKAGDPVPGLPGYTYDWNPTEFDLNASGQFLLATSLQGPGGWSSGIFVIDGAVHDVVAINGDPAPTPGAEPFSYVSDQADLNDAGDVAFYAEVHDLLPGRGIFARLGGSLTLVAIEGQTAPGAAGRTLEFPSNPRPSIDESGTIAFGAWLAPCCSSPGSGIFRWQAGVLESLVLAGDPVPGSDGRVFDSVAGPRINTAGAVVFEGASYDGQNQWIQGIYWVEDGVVSTLVEGGDPIPGAGSRLESLSWQSLEINERGDVMFPARLTDGRDGIFLLTNEAPPVPGLGAVGLGLLAFLLGALGWRISR